ncbi:NtrC-family two-component system sensor histidine kinase KinB [Pedobacter sp. UYP30]|uniref:ATP-binding protein n=1 Tax=Pedobacter sp. UYP30 TaxID=1756400 RepID=UPI00339084C4
MKIKKKLRLGFGFLFIVVLSFGALSLYYMNKISVSSKVILKDNYESLKYTRVMRAILDDNELPLSTDNASAFKRQLNQEEKNITEKGEEQAVSIMKTAFSEISSRNLVPTEIARLQKQMRLQLRNIDKLNMDAIVRKNETAQQGVEKAASYLIFAASVCALILFSFVVNFPSFVANPLKELSEAIKGISRRNYKQHLTFNGDDEFSELAAEFNAMASQLNKWENTNLAKLQSEKLRIDAIIEQMQDAIIGLNENKEILFLNHVAIQLLGLNVKDAVGASALKLMKKNDLLNKVLQTCGNEKPMKIYADNKESYFQLERREIIVPTYEEQHDAVVMQTGKNAGEVYILKNITQYKELDEAKTNFIATVSHELKTPIASIKMSLKLINDERVGKMNTEQKELVNNIGEDCGRLLKITSELLDLAQVETGNLQLKFSKTDPQEIADYAIEAVKFQAEQKAVQLELITKGGLSFINVDIEKTAWVLTNLLSNALRYSAEKSKVIIQITEKGSNVEYSVRDFGKGIEEQYQKRLFDRYYQVPTDGSNKSGSGLGLAISKDFIEAENGKIWVESAVGEGSTFTFALPIAKEL